MKKMMVAALLIGAAAFSGAAHADDAATCQKSDGQGALLLGGGPTGDITCDYKTSSGAQTAVVLTPNEVTFQALNAQGNPTGAAVEFGGAGPDQGQLNLTFAANTTVRITMKAECVQDPACGTVGVVGITG